MAFRDASRCKHNVKMKQKDTKISYFAAHITTIVSVTLVLIIVGVIAMISVCGAGVGRQVKEQIEISAIMKDSVANEQALALCEQLKSQSYVNTIDFISKEEAMQNWTRDTGENLEEIFGVNPLSPEISMTLKAEYTHADSISRIVSTLETNPLVEGVARQNSEEVVSTIDNIENLSIILAIIALALIVISFVLINNTVHLSIYSRRFTIHTMQLVGATNGFIRRPFIVGNMLSGVIAAVLASAILASVVQYIVSYEFPQLTQYMSWGNVGIIIIGLFLFGAAICSVAAWAATTKYLRRDYDQLFK